VSKGKTTHGTPITPPTGIAMPHGIGGLICLLHIKELASQSLVYLQHGQPGGRGDVSA
jgi:hypothetical protein